MNSNHQNLPELLETAVQAAKAGGKRLLDWLGKTTVTEKGLNDPVTQADFDSQQTIRQFISKRHPNHLFLGEEDDGSLNKLVDDEYCWIVDPLDGTQNFSHQLPGFSVSIALAHKRQVIVAAVFDPLLNECFTAMLGEGAFCNGNPIQVSQCAQLSNSLTVCSFPGKIDRTGPEVKRFLNILTNGSGSVRRLGSAALNLSYVACGRLDAYWATSVKIWDVAAGFLIISESGGSIIEIEGGILDLNEPRFIAAGTQSLMDEMFPLMQVD